MKRLAHTARLGCLILLATLSSWSCVQPAPPGPTPPSAFQKPCADFCQHLQALQCREGAPLADGTPCETFCRKTQEAGHDLKISCVLQVQSCAELQRCR